MNGTQQEVDETTPLLSTNFIQHRPAILPAVHQYRLGGSDDSNLQDSHTFVSEAERTAFLLLVWLHYIETQSNALNDSLDILENWQQASVASSFAEDNERRARETLDHFLTIHSGSSAIQTVFWTSFPLESTGNASTRVIDMLAGKHSPPELLSHPVVEAVVMKCWKYGVKTESSQRLSLMERFDALSTPRILHLIDIIGRLAFMGSLIHYLLYPPRFFITLGRNEQGAREIFLTFMAAASLARRWSIHTLPVILVFLAFILTLPSVPLPGYTSFSMLHIALLLQLILLHLPNSPSLPVAIIPKHTMPLSMLLLHGVTSVFMPVMLFFLPALLLAAFLVSASLTDTLLPVLPKHLDAPPIDSRLSFFVLSITVIFLLLGALVTTSAMFPTLASSSASTSKWDRYSREIGLRSRRTFVEALVQYENNRFPVPFNTLQLLVRVPFVALSWLGHPATPKFMKSVEKVLWRVTVGLIGAVVSSLWVWGLI